MTAQPPGNSDSRGIILIVVLWVVAMMTVIVVALSAYAQKNLSLASVETDRLRSELALQAGLDAGEAMIVARKPEERVFFDGSAVTVDVGGGRLVEIALMDVAGLVDVNRADPELLTSLASKLELSPAQSKPWLDEVMKARQARSQAKAGEQQPQQFPPPQQPKPGDQPEDAGANQTETKQKHALPAFFSITQLYRFEGVDSAAVDKILPFISLYSSDGKVNPMAAPETVIESIPGIGPDEIGILMTARQRRNWKTGDVEQVIGEHDNFLAIGESKVFMINVKAVSGQGLIAGSRLEAVVISDEAGGLPFQVLSWSW